MKPTSAGKPRKQLHGQVSPAAHDGWNLFCVTNGCGSVSALLEALGMQLGDAAGDPDHPLNEALQSVVLAARRERADRRTSPRK